MKKKNKTLPIEKHQEIASILRGKVIRNLLMDIPNTYGTSSRVGKLSQRAYRLIMDMTSEMESMCYKDGFSEQATNIYYGPPHV